MIKRTLLAAAVSAVSVGAMAQSNTADYPGFDLDVGNPIYIQGDDGITGDQGANGGLKPPMPGIGLPGDTGEAGDNGGVAPPDNGIDIGPEQPLPGVPSGPEGTTAASAASAAVANVSNTRANLKNVNSQVSSRLNSTRRGIATGDSTGTTGFWGQITAADGKLASSSKMEGFKSDTTAITVGMDTELNGNWTVGGAFTYIDTEVKASGSSRTTTTGYMGTLYAGYTGDNWTLDNTLNLGYGDNDIRDNRFVENRKDSYNDRQVGIRSIAGYELVSGDTWVKPLAGVNYNRIKMDKHTIGNTHINSQNFETMEAGLGIELGHTMALGNGTLEPSVNIMYWHDFKDDAQTVSYRYVDSGITARAVGPDLGDKTVEARVGVDYVMDNGLTVTAGYTRIDQDKYSSNNYMAKLRYDF